jgi:hypothetical protein
MARVRALAESGAISVTASPTTKTLLGLTAPANQALALKRFLISCEGVAPTDKPVLVEIGTVTGGTSAGVTERQIAGPSVTVQGAGVTYSVEPTWTVYYGWYLHLQSGYEKVLQLAEDEWVFLNSTVALRVTNPSGNSTTNIRASVEWEE